LLNKIADMSGKMVLWQKFDVQSVNLPQTGSCQTVVESVVVAGHISNPEYHTFDFQITTQTI